MGIDARRVCPVKRTSQKTKLASVLAELRDRGFEPALTDETYRNIVDTGMHSKNLPLAIIATQILLDEHPITLRGLFYRVVSAQWLPTTDKKHYDRLGRMMTRLREAGIVPFHWFVDNLRSSIKPSSWSGLNDFADTVRNAYRMDFWARLPEYVHVIVEKDAIAGVFAPVTRSYDVALSPVRGYVSLSFAHDIAKQWNAIEKPIFVYYAGDFDPSGFDLERDLKAKLTRYCDREFQWERLAVNSDDFEKFDLFPLEPKKTDRRYQKFVENYGYQCAELDALPATELRRRVRDAIESHIPSGEWERLQELEELERGQWNEVMAALSVVS